MPTTDTLIIGAGPAGLAMAGRLKQLNIPFVLLEKSAQVGHSWHLHYDRLHLHTVKEHSGLPHWDMPADYPVYVSRSEIIAYWENYVSQMGLSVLFNQEVKSVKRVGEGWVTETSQGKFESKRVIIATGYNRVPYQPQWLGQEHFKGSIVHSCQYRNGKPYAGQKVLIIGIGNTGAELALDLYENGASPTISVRSPVNFIKRDVAGRPAQRTAILLGKLPPSVYDFIAKRIQKITIGDLTPYGLQPSPYAPSEQLRRFGKVPIIDIGTLDLIKQRKVLIRPDVKQFNQNSVTFVDGQTEAFDAVIVCTGYRAQVEDFVENAQDLLNERGYPKDLWSDNPAFKDLYFCGFSIPLSGILRNIKMDSEKIANHIVAQRL
ncbi:MAG: NAD(P)/FAD-dependent oxidoreductase [Spirosomataceae bacterium]